MQINVEFPRLHNKEAALVMGLIPDGAEWNLYRLTGKQGTTGAGANGPSIIKIQGIEIEHCMRILRELDPVAHRTGTDG